MKKSFFVFMAMFFAVGMYAQDAYYCLRQGAELIYRSTDPKGRETGTTTVVIKAVTGSDGNYELVQTTEISLGKLDLGKPVAVSASIKDNNLCVFFMIFPSLLYRDVVNDSRYVVICVRQSINELILTCLHKRK